MEQIEIFLHLLLLAEDKEGEHIYRKEKKTMKGVAVTTRGRELWYAQAKGQLESWLSS